MTSTPHPVPGFSPDRIEADALRRMLDSTGLALIRLDAAGRVRYASPAALALNGWVLTEVLGRPLADLIDPADLPAFRRNLADESPVVRGTASLPGRGGRPVVLDYLIRRVLLADGQQEFHIYSSALDGAPTTAEVALPAVPAPRSAPAQVVAPALDGLAGLGRTPTGVTPLRDRNAQLSDAEKDDLLAVLAAGEELAGTGSGLVDEEGRFIWSDGTYRIVGATIPTDGGSRHLHIEDFVHPDDLPWLSEKLYEIYVSPGELDAVFRIVRGDTGAVRYFRARSATSKTAASSLIIDKAWVSLGDITEEVMAARALACLSQASVLLAAATDAQTLLEAVCATIVTDGAYRYAAYLQPDTGGRMQLRVSSGSGRWFADEVLTQATTAFSTGPQVTLPPADSPDAPGSPEAVFLPVRRGHGCVGVLALWSDEVAAFDAASQAPLRALADGLGAALGRLEPTVR